MFLKRCRRKANGEVYEYWNLVKTVRTERGPRHQTVATLGKAPGLDSQSRRGWEDIADLLEGLEPAPRQLQLGQSGRNGEDVSADGHRRQWTQVDIRGLRIENVREFGQVYLALALWRRLGVPWQTQRYPPLPRTRCPPRAQRRPLQAPHGTL